MVVKILFLIVFFAITLGVGIYCHKHSTNVNGFVLGGRNVGPWLTAFAYGTSYFSAVIFVGYAGQFGWKFGIASTWIGIGNAVIGSLLAWVILGRRTRLMTRQLNASTMPEYFEKRFDSKAMKIISSIIIFVFLIPYTASLYNGLSRLFEMAFDIDYSICIIIMAVLTCIYVIAGGYMATAINDFIQGIIMLFGIVIVIVAVLNVHGGFSEAFKALASVQDPAVSTTPGVFSSIFGPDPFGLLSVVVLTSLGTWGLPQMVTKIYAVKTEADIKKGTIISTIFAVIVAGGCYFLGGFARLLDPSVVANGGFDAIIPALLSPLGDAIIGLVIILVLAASMSTLSSLVLTSSSTLVLDLIKGTSKKEIDSKKSLLLIKIFVLVFIAISVIIAIFQYNSADSFIAQFMGISWGALAGAFLAPMMYGLYSKKVTKTAVFTNFAVAITIMLSNMLFKAYLPTVLQSPINCGAIAMLLGLIIVPVVSLFTKKLDKSVVDNSFACYEKTVTVKATNVLTDVVAENEETNATNE